MLYQEIPDFLDHPANIAFLQRRLFVVRTVIPLPQYCIDGHCGDFRKNLRFRQRVHHDLDRRLSRSQALMDPVEFSEMFFKHSTANHTGGQSMLVVQRFVRLFQQSGETFRENKFLFCDFPFIQF